MKLTIATEFDNKKHEEVFQKITITQATAQDLVDQYISNLGYGQRQQFVKQFAVKPAKKKKMRSARVTYTESYGRLRDCSYAPRYSYICGPYS